MRHVVTLIASPTAPSLQNSMVEAVETALAECGARVGNRRWLAADIACDVAFDSPAPEAAEASMRRAVGGRPVDVVVQPLAGRRKKVLVADLERTIIENEMLDEIAARAGRGAEVAAITDRAMEGKIDFKEALARRVALLAGLPAAALIEAREVIRFVPGARTLVATMRKAGAYTVLVSGGFVQFSAYVREHLGFDRDVANELEIADHRLTGRVVEPILDDVGKAAALRGIARNRKVRLGETVAVGDGANDAAMIAAAGLGVAYRARAVLRAKAPARIDHGDLTAVLYAQGYRADEFAP